MIDDAESGEESGGDSRMDFESHVRKISLLTYLCVLCSFNSIIEGFYICLVC